MFHNGWRNEHCSKQQHHRFWSCLVENGIPHSCIVIIPHIWVTTTRGRSHENTILKFPQIGSFFTNIEQENAQWMWTIFPGNHGFSFHGRFLMGLPRHHGEISPFSHWGPWLDSQPARSAAESSMPKPNTATPCSLVLLSYLSDLSVYVSMLASAYLSTIYLSIYLSICLLIDRSMGVSWVRIPN